MGVLKPVLVGGNPHLLPLSIYSNSNSKENCYVQDFLLAKTRLVKIKSLTNPILITNLAKYQKIH